MNFCKMERTPKGYSYRRVGPNVKVVGIKYNATYKEVTALAAKALQVPAEETVLVYSGAIIPSEDRWRIGKYLEDGGLWVNKHKIVFGLTEDESVGFSSDVSSYLLIWSYHNSHECRMILHHHLLRDFIHFQQKSMDPVCCYVYNYDVNSFDHYYDIPVGKPKMCMDIEEASITGMCNYYVL